MNTQYIIIIGSKTYYKYGGNTRDIRKALVFEANELAVAQNIATKLCESGKLAAVVKKPV